MGIETCLGRGHDLQITRALSHGHSWKEATGLICIDAKPYFVCVNFTVSFKCFVVTARWETIEWGGPMGAFKGPCEPCFLRMAPEGPSQRTDKVGSLGVSCVHVPENGCPEDNSASFSELPSNSAPKSVCTIRRPWAWPGLAQPWQYGGKAKAQILWDIICSGTAASPAAARTDRSINMRQAPGFKHMGPHFSTEV